MKYFWGGGLLGVIIGLLGEAAGVDHLTTLLALILAAVCAGAFIAAIEKEGKSR